MPVYQYRDTRDGSLTELCKPVAERDDVPNYLQRITVPVRVSIHGTSNDLRDPKAADSSVPAALKSLSGSQVNQMVKESGMSRDTFKQAWGL